MVHCLSWYLINWSGHSIFIYFNISTKPHCILIYVVKVQLAMYVHELISINKHSLPGMPNGIVRIVFIFIFFFRRQSFRTITFERPGGSDGNFRRSWVIKGRSVSFSNPTFFLLFRTPGTFFEKTNCSKKKLFRTPNHSMLIYFLKVQIGWSETAGRIPNKRHILVFFKYFCYMDTIIINNCTCIHTCTSTSSFLKVNKPDLCNLGLFLNMLKAVLV